MNDRTKIYHFSSLRELSVALAADILKVIEDVQKKQKKFALVLSGGRTPVAVHKEIVRQINQYDVFWKDVLCFFSDERCVSPNLVMSNYHMVYATLLQLLSIPEKNIYRIRGELGSEMGAEDYQKTLLEVFEGQKPVFDLALLGMGPDGHTASLFPLSLALDDQTHLVLKAGPGPEGVERITLTYVVLNAAKRVWFMVAGHNKRYAFQKVFDVKTDVRLCPAKGIHPEGELRFYVYLK